jgi:hypothetical protein
MADFQITGLTVINRDAWENGDRLVAIFDFEAGGLRVRGVSLVRTVKHGFRVMLPKIDGPRGDARSVSLTDRQMRHRIMEEARQIYVAFGGRYGEWVPMADRVAATGDHA